MSETAENADAEDTALAKREERDPDDVAGKLLDFLTRCMSEKDTRRAMRVEIRCLSDGYRSEPLEAWSRESDPELFGNLAHTEAMVATLVKLAEEHTDAAAESSVFEVKCRAYDNSVKQRKIRIDPTRRVNDERNMLLPHETPTGTGMLAMSMRHTEKIMNLYEQQSQSTAALQRGSVDAILKILKEAREENAELRAERKAHLAEIEAARSEETERDMRYAAQESSDKRKAVMVDKFAMILPVLAQAIAGRLMKGKDGAKDGKDKDGKDPSSDTPGSDPATPKVRSPLEETLLKFMETMTDQQIAAIKSVLDMEQGLVLGAAIDAAEQGGSPLLSTMVNDFINSLRETQLITLIGYLNPDQRMQLKPARRLAKQAV